MKLITKSLSLNERSLVELVFRNGEIARVDLTRATNMTAASVTRLTAGLEDLGIFEQKTEKAGARGQPKKLLSIRRTAFRSVGIYLYRDRMVGVLIDFTGTVLGQKTMSVSQGSPDEIILTAKALVMDLIVETKTDIRCFIGVGLSVPGNFGEFGRTLKAHKLFDQLEDYSTLDQGSEAPTDRIYLENDGTAAALGEYLFGRRKKRDPLFLIHIGYGLGGGAVLGGRPFRGLNGNACLPGSLFPYEGDRPTLQDLSENLSNHGFAIENIRDLPPQEQIANPVVEEWLTRSAIQIRYAAQVISGMFDPELIVVGGALPSPMAEKLIELVNAKPIASPSRGLEAAPVVPTRLGELNGPIGAGSIPFFRTFFPGFSTERGNAFLNGRSGS